MRRLHVLATLTLSALLLGGCGKKETTTSLTEGGMKCGAGKCGASMGGGSKTLIRKKSNILSQLRKDDPRRDCVLKARDVKRLYACVTDIETGRLSTKCSAQRSAALHKKIPPKKAESTMKCEAGKCGS